MDLGGRIDIDMTMCLFYQDSSIKSVFWCNDSIISIFFLSRWTFQSKLEFRTKMQG